MLKVFTVSKDTPTNISEVAFSTSPPPNTVR